MGGLLAVLPLLVTKYLEFVIPPLGDGLSKAVMGLFGMVGGIGMCAVAIPAYPVAYFFKKNMELYSTLREKVRFAVATVYGKTQTEPESSACLHSDEFRQDVAYVNRSSWSVLVRNGLQRTASGGVPAHLPAPPVNVSFDRQVDEAGAEPPPYPRVH